MAEPIVELAVKGSPLAGGRRYGLDGTVTGVGSADHGDGVRLFEGDWELASE
jgi:hypothetical protein